MSRRHHLRCVSQLQPMGHLDLLAVFLASSVTAAVGLPIFHLAGATFLSVDTSLISSVCK